MICPIGMPSAARKSCKSASNAAGSNGSAAASRSLKRANNAAVPGRPQTLLKGRLVVCQLVVGDEEEIGVGQDVAGDLDPVARGGEDAGNFPDLVFGPTPGPSLGQEGTALTPPSPPAPLPEGEGRFSSPAVRRNGSTSSTLRSMRKGLEVAVLEGPELLGIETGRRLVTRSSEKFSINCCRLKCSALVVQRPAQQGQVVDDRLGQIADRARRNRPSRG